MTNDRHSTAMTLGIVCFVALVTIVPPSAAEEWHRINNVPNAAPFDDTVVDRIDFRLRQPGVLALTRGSVLAAKNVAAVASISQSERSALRKARELYLQGSYKQAAGLAGNVVKKTGGDLAFLDLNLQAKILLSNALMASKKPAEAFNTLSQVSGTPIDDYVSLLQGRALAANNKYAAAAEVLERVAKSDSPAKHHARVETAHALYHAKNFRHAESRLRGVLNDYPDYPRRHLALIQYANALSKLSKDVDAADAYLQTYFEFPYRQEGKDALVRLQELETNDTVPARMFTASERYSRYRRLRINKHWEIAEELFEELRSDYASETQDSAFEHEIDLQLALNDYGSRSFESAARRLRALESNWNNGKRNGISRASVYKYLSRTYSAMGEKKKALAARNKMNEGQSVRTREMDQAEFHRDHGDYGKALKIYDKYYTAGQKRGWSYTWLLYKTGKYDRAFESLTALAERSSGQSRAKYLYWTGRTLENAGRLKEARRVFVELKSTHASRYYGFQAANRILDIDQRKGSSPILVNTENLSHAADYVLDAMDEAELALGTARVEEVDPRATQRSDSNAVVVAPPAPHCDAEVQADLDYCLLEVGDLPPNAQMVLQSAFSSSSVMGSVLATGINPNAYRETDLDSDRVEELDGGVRREPEVLTGHMDLGNGSGAKYTTLARIYWDGRFGSTESFAHARGGKPFGPIPEDPPAYDEPDFVGGLDRGAAKIGTLFTPLVRAQWLRSSGMDHAARLEVRSVAIEFRGLSARWRAGSTPHELPNSRWSYYIDNRRKAHGGFWGYESDELRFPIPKEKAAIQRMLKRQQEIYDRRVELKPILMDALKEAGDHFMVRKMTLGTGGWYRRDPTGPARPSWMQAYPRAFPQLVVREAKKNGLNPYALWALMTVESSYNPDSVSPSDALGLLQVIPKTGLKTALMLGDTNFGPHDLLEAETAIIHGAFYFGKLVRKFHGQELLAFAGYNGGPHRVGDWLDMRGDQTLDEFIEEIPFDEARGYAKKVARFVALYLRVYEGRSTLYIGQKLRSDYRANPKF